MISAVSTDACLTGAADRLVATAGLARIYQQLHRSPNIRRTWY